MGKHGIVSREAEEWFNGIHRVIITEGQFEVVNRITGKTVAKRKKYIGMLQYIKNSHASHCRHKLSKAAK